MAERDVESGMRPRRQMHRVPSQLRLKKRQQEYVYNPTMVSIGPYHHGKEELRQMEEFKCHALNMFLLSVKGSRDEGFYYRKIFELIDEIRSCYVGVTAEKYDDAALSKMIFHDGCFVIYFIMFFMGNDETRRHWYQHLGWLESEKVQPELYMVENQIPYWVINFLINSVFDQNEGTVLLRRYLSFLHFGKRYKLTDFPWKEEQPLHLLEASQKIFALQQDSSSKFVSKFPFSIFKSYKKLPIMTNVGTQEFVPMKYFNRQFYSVTELKAKGIHLKPSSTCLKDARFKSHAFHGQLQLPIYFVSPIDYVYLSNMIVFENFPETNTDLVVTSYVNLMKTLIESPKDVKELKQKGILSSNLGSNMEVVKFFQEIDTMGMGIDLFHDLKRSIQEHCNSKVKTWMGELIYTYFRSPWTVISFLAAICFLVLTFLQTYYTIRAA